MVEAVARELRRRGAVASWDRALGLVIVVVAFVISLGISLWSQRVATSQSRNAGDQRVKQLPGWPREVDPIRVIGVARSLSRWDGIRSIVATGVRPDGTIDPTGSGRVRYIFEGTPRPAERRGHSESRRPGELSCPSQTVRLGPDGLRAGPAQTEVRCPAQRNPTLPQPTCDMAQLWKLARTEGAGPDDARIEYHYGSAGPAWRFRTTRGALSFEFSADCKRRIDTPRPRPSLR